MGVVRTVLVAAGAALAGAVAFATPASAAVVITPTEGTQGSALRLAFRVTSDSRTAPVTKVQVSLPEATPIAEVYPLSSPDWAPLLTQKNLDKPIEAIHGTQTTQVVTAVTWTAMPGKATKPGQTAVLECELGPLPQADRLVFTVTQTHSDGSVTRADAALTLVPATGAPPGHNAHSGETAAAPAADDDNGGGGTTLALVISGLVVGLLAGAVVGGVAVARARRGRALTVAPEALESPDLTRTG